MPGKLHGDTGQKSYAWVILIVLFIVHLAGFGIRSTFGVYVAPWEQEFTIGRSLVSSISMLSFFAFCAGQLIGGKLNDWFGKGIVPAAGVFLMGASLILTSQADQIWKIIILYGIGFSLGSSISSITVPSAIITNWFVKKRGFALGLIMAGLAVGQLILAPASLFLVENIGWRATMTVLGIIMIVAVGPLCLFLIRSKPAEKGLKPYGYEESVDSARNPGGIKKEGEKPLPILGVFKLRLFWQLIIPYFICGFTDGGIVLTHLIPIATGRGLTTPIIAIAYSLIAIANIAGTIVTGHLSDHISRTRQMAIIYTIRAVTYVVLIALNQPWMLLLFAAMYGAVEMATIAPINSLAVQLFDRFPVSIILALVTVSHNIGSAIGAWIPGLLFDFSGSYHSSLVISIILLIAAALIALKTPDPAFAPGPPRHS